MKDPYVIDGVTYTSVGDEVVNEYWMYPNEPFHLCRFVYNGTRYLIGKEIPESAGVVQTRQLKGYARPSDDIISQLFGADCDHS